MFQHRNGPTQPARLGGDLRCLPLSRTPTASCRPSRQTRRNTLSWRLGRAARLASLDPEQFSLALWFLLGYLPAAVDAALEAVEPCGGDPEPEMEPYCVSCGAQVGIFRAHGPEYRHFKGVLSEVSKPRPYKADHAPKVGWRPATDIPPLI